MTNTIAVVQWFGTIDGSPVSARNTDAQYDWILESLERTGTAHTIFVYSLMDNGSYDESTLLYRIG